MIINIASFGGRTHMLDTARELEKLGHVVRFYSYVPTKRAIKYGLKKECSFSLFYWALPFLLLIKIFGKKLPIRRIYFSIFDYFTAIYMKPCDVFIGQSPMHKYSLIYAKKKYNALTILERGSLPGNVYNAQLKDDPILKGRNFLSKKSLKREYESYKYADYISVGATHVRDAFIKEGFIPEKIFVNNYGFNLDFFRPTILDSVEQYDILQIGNWSYNKGCELISNLCREKKYKFLHVGSLISEFPNESNMKHYDPQPESELIKFYKKAKVFIMPSYSEGLAMVQVQAIACGLPLVCSKHSGGKDLRKYLKSEDWIIEMTENTVAELDRCIQEALQKSKMLNKERCFIKPNIYNEVSWEGYGRRYNDFLLKVK